MEYSVSDKDVQAYLDELKDVVFTLGPSSSTGLENLGVIVEFLQSNIDEILYRSKDHLSFISARYSRVSTILQNLEDTTKNNSNLDLRYGFHKSLQKSIKNFSGFMKIINLHTDTDLIQYSRSMSEYRRELAMLNSLITQLSQQIDYLNNIKIQLPQLAALCKST